MASQCFGFLVHLHPFVFTCENVTLSLPLTAAFNYTLSWGTPSSQCYKCYIHYARQMYTSLRQHLKSEAKILSRKETKNNIGSPSSAENDQRARSTPRMPTYGILPTKVSGINSYGTSDRIPNLYQATRATESAVWYGRPRNLKEEIEEAERLENIGEGNGLRMPSINEDEGNEDSVGNKLQIPSKIKTSKVEDQVVEDSVAKKLRMSRNIDGVDENRNTTKLQISAKTEDNVIEGIAAKKLQMPPKANQTKIAIPFQVAKLQSKISLFGSNMQRKYNMALQHFYQAATHSSAEDDKNLKERLNDLSSSDEELFSAERGKTESYEMMEKNPEDGKFDSNYNENTYFTFNKKRHKLSVKRIKPVSLCTPKGCGIFWLWCIFFIVGVFSVTYFLKIAIGRIQPELPTANTPICYGRYCDTPSSHLRENHLGDIDSCSHFTAKEVWNQTFEKFQTESAIRLVDVNLDGIQDFISGFVTSLDSGDSDLKVRRNICKEYYNNKFPCFGGVFAVDGRNGDVLWTHYSMHDIFAVNCNGDIDQDGIADCLAAGRGGTFEAVSGKNGELLWMFLDEKHRSDVMNLYTPQFINDIDNDGILDILQIHGGDPFAEPFSEDRLSAKILFFSGKTGIVLRSIPVPDNAESYFSPVIYTTRNGSNTVVFGTGGETHAGGLYAISLDLLWQRRMDKVTQLAKDTKTGKGYMNPPVLVDINKDGVVDIVSAGFANKIQVFDGETLKPLWTFKMVGTETYSIPGVGYYNEDDTVDFMVRLNNGPGFPVYYDSKMLLLDGKTGKPITNTYKTSAPAHSSPLTVSMEGTGNDLFLFWSVDCTGHEHEGGWFEYVNGTNVHESSRADSCFARYNTKSFSKFFVTNRNIGFPGKEIYFSKDFEALERKQRKRHIGVPDHGGVQRIIQTGTIAPSLGDDGEELSNRFDVVFAMYYITPPQVRSIRPEEARCIEEYRKEAKAGLVKNKIDLTSNERSGIFDHGDTAANVCLGKRLNKTRLDNQESAGHKNFNRGSLTLYRFQVTCKCDHDLKQCARVLPQREQGWLGYMGSMANGYFNERPIQRFHGHTAKTKT